MYGQTRQYDYPRPLPGLPYSRSTRRYYSRRGIRVYPQRLLSQQQSQTSCRHGTDVGEKFNSEVPDTLEELVKLPGVGRKTANVIQSVVFNKAAMAVDTHVFRVSHRLGLVSDKCTTPFSVEKELVKHIPEADIPIAHHWLILHGRYVCQARTPQCDTCGLQLMCKYYCQKYKVSKESGKDKE